MLHPEVELHALKKTKNRSAPRIGGGVVVAKSPVRKYFPDPGTDTEIHATLAELSARIAARGHRKPIRSCWLTCRSTRGGGYILRFPEEFFGPN